MCGRFGLTPQERMEAGEWSDTHVPAPADIGAMVRDQPPRYNIAPTQPVLTVRIDGGAITPAELRWGIGVGAGDRPRQMINVRAETALKGGLFNALLDRHRVLIPASWFYEWKRSPGGKRGQPMMIAPAAEEQLLLAGLESRWTDPKSGETVPAVVIMTTSPNELLTGIHDRMPVIVPEASWGRWLDPDADAGDVADLLAPFPTEGLTARPVSTLVNNVANDGPALIEPLAAREMPEDAQLRFWK